jgi:hypothetical protein
VSGLMLLLLLLLTKCLAGWAADYNRSENGF